MIRPCNSLYVAQTIMTVLNQELNNSMFDSRRKWKDVLNDSNIWYSTFDNCRGQGYVIKIIPNNVGKMFYIAFSEHKNCGRIVVYCYQKTMPIKNIPDNGEYKDAKYFGEGEYSKAVKHIMKRIKKGIKN